MLGALCSALDTACRIYGGDVAMLGDSYELQYRDLGENARAVAAALLDAGLQPDEPVHIRVSNQPLDVAAILGVWLARGVAVPVHRTTPQAVAVSFAQRTQARWQLDLQPPSFAASALSAIAASSPPQRPLLKNAAFVIFTSGSTGTPKGVVVAHEAFYDKIRQIDSLLRLGRDDRTLLVLNITFSFGLWVSLLTLLAGGVLVMRSRFEPELFLRTLHADRVTRAGMVPTMMRVLFADARFGDTIDLVNAQDALRQIWIGGESLGASLARTIRARFAATDLVDIYGLTETATCDFFAFPADYAKHPGCIGRPSPGVRFRISNEAGEEVATGSTAELQIRSPYLMKGYLDQPELTSAAYQDGWFRTGDLGRVVQDDVVELMGRQKELISRAGNKVTPTEIEAAICSHPDIAAAMAVGIADPVLGERIHVVVVPRSGATISGEELRRHLEPRLERYKRPDAYYVAGSLPLGRTGKADRGELRSLVTSAALAPLDA